MSSERMKFGLFQNAPETVLFAAGKTVFEAGDDGKVMYAIKRGKIVIELQGKTMDTLGEGEVFGEMALLNQRRRAATAVTLEETELVEIDETQFYLLVRQNPAFALQMMRLLSERLRQADALYAT